MPDYERGSLLDRVRDQEDSADFGPDSELGIGPPFAAVEELTVNWVHTVAVETLMDMGG